MASVDGTAKRVKGGAKGGSGRGGATRSLPAEQRRGGG
jgi:hypothetical protein